MGQHLRVCEPRRTTGRGKASPACGGPSSNCWNTSQPQHHRRICNGAHWRANTWARSLPMAALVVWQRRFRPSIRGCVISAAGCTRCGIFWRKFGKRDDGEAKTGAQAIYLAESRVQAEQAFRRFRARWHRKYGAMVRRLERNLPELLPFYAFPRHLRRKLRPTNVIDAALWKCSDGPVPWFAL